MVALPKVTFCWILLIFGTTNGGELVEFDVTETKTFSASLECRPLYQSNHNIECKFYLKNNDQRDYSVLKLHTPLEGEPSDCLKVTRNGKKLEYDGIFVKRSLPGPEDFILVAAGETVSSTFDVSSGYDMSESGTYTVAVDTYLEYVKGSVKGMNVPDKAAIPTKIGRLSSPVVVFNVTENLSRKTLGQKARFLEKSNRFPFNVFSSRSTQENANLGKRSNFFKIPRDPAVVGGTAAQRAELKEVHRAAYHYVKAAIPDLNSSPERVKTWFGKLSNKVVSVYKAIKDSLEKDVIHYSLYPGPRYCRSSTYAYTYKNSRSIYLCNVYLHRSIFDGPDNKVGVLVHELAHARASASDIVYGREGCKSLAKNNPERAHINAESYEYFVETLHPFNQGIDAMTTLSDGYAYMFKGNFYLKVSKEFRYSMGLLKWRFGNLPGKFAQGFDSFVCHKVYGRAYATNGDQYIRFTDTSAKTLSAGYPKPIAQNWDLSSPFGSSFDSMVQLPNGVTYATKDEQFVRYSDKGHLFKVDSDFPKTLNSGAWGSLSENFRSGFDAMFVHPNGKLYVFKGTEYIRFTNPMSVHIDSGYPLPIKGNWGNAAGE